MYYGFVFDKKKMFIYLWIWQCCGDTGFGNDLGFRDHHDGPCGGLDVNDFVIDERIRNENVWN